MKEAMKDWNSWENAPKRCMELTDSYDRGDSMDTIYDILNKYFILKEHLSDKIILDRGYVEKLIEKYMFDEEAPDDYFVGPKELLSMITQDLQFLLDAKINKGKR